MIGAIFEGYLFIGIVTAVFTLVQVIMIHNGYDYFMQNDGKSLYKESVAGFDKLRADGDYSLSVMMVGMFLGSLIIGLLWILPAYNIVFGCKK